MRIINLNQIRRDEEAKLRKIHDQYYVFNRVSCYAVNLTGAMIFNSIGKDVSYQVLLNKLAEKFLVENCDVLEKDVSDFLDFLEKEGLLHIL